MKPPFSSVSSSVLQLVQNSLTVSLRLQSNNTLQKFLFAGAVLLFSLCFTKAYAQANSFPYTQSFEEPFATGTSVQFLPNWWGNEVSSSSRIYQSSFSHSGSTALAAAPTTSFVADIRLLLNTQSLQAATLHFWARSSKNGSGSRAALLELSYSADGGASFSEPVLIGTTSTFPNADTDYQLYTFSLPPEVLGTPNAVMRWQVRRSEEGAGTAATLLLDDVMVEEATAQLQLLSAVALSAQEVLLTFNLPVQETSAEQVANYTINPATVIEAAQVSATNSRQVLLQLNALAAGNYTLTASNILPIGEAEALETTSISFTYTASPGFRDIVINEIFADPNPKGTERPQPVVLPTAAEAEFVELFNASTNAFNLQQLRLSGGKLPDYLLQPGEYILLVPAGYREAYALYGPVAEVEGWKSLSNSGTALQLLDTSTGRILDSLHYTTNWYQESSKNQGGWSLEQINPYLQCSFSDNWRAATNTKGATPGAPNSVLETTADIEAPQLLQAVAIDNRQLVLLFDEYIAPASVTGAVIELEPAIGVANIRHQGNQLVVTFVEELTEAGNYRLTLSGLTDCTGNSLEAASPILFPKLATAGDVLINEIMYNPLPEGAEWVELYNPTNQHLNLQGWYLGLMDGSLRSTVKLSSELLLLPPKSYIVLTDNAAAVQQLHSQASEHVVVELSDFPSLRNSGDTLVLLTPAVQVAEVASFSDTYHHPLLRDTKGVSLERISPSMAALTATNWTSAGAPFYSSPGMPNSQNISLQPEAQILRIQPQVLEPTPDGVADVTFIHYQLTQPGLSGTLLILDTSGREVLRLANNQVLGQEGTFQWNGTNASGERVRNGYYIVVLSVFGTDGQQQKWRKTMVVANWL